MTTIDTLNEVNKCFKQFMLDRESYINSIGKGSKLLFPNQTQLLTKQIPSLLYKLVENQSFIIKASVGIGLVTETPWVAIMNKEITKTTQEGVYIVFLFNSTLEKIYLCLGIGANQYGNSKKGKQSMISFRNQLRSQLKASSSSFELVEELDVLKKDYKNAAVYCHEWPLETTQDNLTLFNEYINLYQDYIKMQKDKVNSNEKKEDTKHIVTKNNNDLDIITDFDQALKQSNLIFKKELISRFISALATKPFVILSGLSGSGKTRLATSFARWISVNYKDQVCLVPVGADWTNREFLLGYVNALETDKYQETEVVRLILRAQKDKDNPYFLILDEMNLSYVERYFADFLSAMESGGSISLWKKPNGSKCDIPDTIERLPQNLFIIGTINVDETTYMFSPKVLDRANVIEFRIMKDDIKEFFNGFNPVNDSVFDKNTDSSYGQKFVNLATTKEMISEDLKEQAINTLSSFFEELKIVHAEFGYRTASEIFRFIALYKQFDSSAEYNTIVDAAIVQKLLPKLHGSRKQIVDVLNKLWYLCINTPADNTDLNKVKEYNKVDCKYPLSAEKIYRMYNIAIDNGYANFAEA